MRTWRIAGINGLRRGRLALAAALAVAGLTVTGLAGVPPGCGGGTL